MAQQGEGMGFGTILLIGLGGYLLYSWYESQSAAAATTTSPATPAVPIATTTAPYTTAVTNQPASTTTPAPATPPSTPPSTPGPPPVTPVQSPVNVPGGGGGVPVVNVVSCPTSAWNAMATALQALALAGYSNPPMDSSGRLNAFQWDYYVETGMQGQGVTPAVLLATGNQNANNALYTVCDYMALRAQYSANTGLSGVGRLNMPLRWKR